MNFTLGIIIAVGVLVAISLGMISMDPGYLAGIPEKPVACTKEYVPVCGVDGVTYGNSCTLDAAGVTMDYSGECVELIPESDLVSHSIVEPITEPIVEPIVEPTPEPIVEPIPEPIPESVDTFMISIPLDAGIPGCDATSECYIPSSLEIKVGNTVTWSNNDVAAHTVTSGTPADGVNGIFDSSLFMSGDTFSFTFDTSGVYPYFCMVHPWMTGEIIVNETHDAMAHEIAVGEPTVSDESTDIAKSMVSNAVALYDEIGLDSFESFNSSPDFHDGDIYIFVFQDSDSVMVSHGAHTSMIGKPVNEILDINGDSIGLMIHQKATEDGVWVEYLWEDPVDGKVHPKTSWVIIHDGYIFGSGAYAPESVEPITEPAPVESEKRAAPVQVAMAQGSGAPGCEDTNECFLPYQAEIYSGEPIVWINSDSAAHTVTSGSPSVHDGLFDSGMLMSGQTWEYVFSESGEYDYHCMIHPWMTGKVIVK